MNIINAQKMINTDTNRITYSNFLVKRIDNVIEKMEEDKIELQNISDLHNNKAVQFSAKRFLKWNDRILRLLYRFQHLISSDKISQKDPDKISKEWDLLMERQSIIRKRYFLLIIQHSVTTNFSPKATA